MDINEELLKDNELLQLMSGRLKEEAADKEVIEGIRIEQEVEEVLDQHIREKEELMEENNEFKGGLKERDEKLKEQNRLIEELKKQLKNKK